jgi:hypothetical protein
MRCFSALLHQLQTFIATPRKTCSGQFARHKEIECVVEFLRESASPSIALQLSYRDIFLEVVPSMYLLQPSLKVILAKVIHGHGVPYPRRSRSHGLRNRRRQLSHQANSELVLQTFIYAFYIPLEAENLRLGVAQTEEPHAHRL